MHIHVLRYLPFIAYAIVMLWFHIKKWDYFKGALSDGGNPSATRLCGYVLIQVVALCEVYTTVRTEDFKMQHLQWLICGALAFFGILKISEVLAVWKGGTSKTDKDNGSTSV